MKITTYRELESKNELLPLMDQAFEWPFSPMEFEEEIKDHPRLKDNPVGYAAIEDSQLVGFVGVMDLATRTIDGAEETVGGIWGVATHPAYARRGISTALMQRTAGDPLSPTPSIRNSATKKQWHSQAPTK